MRLPLTDVVLVIRTQVVDDVDEHLRGPIPRVLHLMRLTARQDPFDTQVHISRATPIVVPDQLVEKMWASADLAKPDPALDGRGQ